MDAWRNCPECGSGALFQSRPRRSERRTSTGCLKFCGLPCPKIVTLWKLVVFFAVNLCNELKQAIFRPARPVPIRLSTSYSQLVCASPQRLRSGSELRAALDSGRICRPENLPGGGKKTAPTAGRLRARSTVTGEQFLRASFAPPWIRNGNARNICSS